MQNKAPEQRESKHSLEKEDKIYRHLFDFHATFGATGLKLCASRYLSLGLDLLNLDHRVQGEILTILLVHLVVHPGHGVIHLLLHLRYLQFIQVIVLLILVGETQNSLLFW